MSADIVAADQLKAIVQRVERLEAEIADLNADKSEIYKEARANGFDVKIIKKVVSKRKIDEHERVEQDHVFDLYWDAVHGLNLVHAYARENIEKIPASDGSPSVSSELTTRSAEESVVSNHSRPAALAVSGGEPSIPSPDAGGVKMDDCNHPGRSDDKSGHTNAQSGRATIPHSEKATVATQGEATEPPSDDSDDDCCVGQGEVNVAANAGGDHVDGNALRVPTSVTGEGAANTALPAAGVVMEYVPPTGMKRLPFAHCFPDLSKAEYERLEKDIAANRVREPIIRQGDVIVDGWARYNISRAYGMSYPVLELHPSRDVLLSIIKWQRAARNFTPAQERKIASELAKEFPSRADDIMAAFGLAEALEAAE